MSVMSCPWRTACARHGAHARPARWRVPDGAGSSGTRSGSDGTRHGQRETGPCRTVRRVRGPAVRAGRSTSRHGVAEQPDSRVLLVRGDCGHARRPLRKPAGDKSPEGPEQACASWTDARSPRASHHAHPRAASRCAAAMDRASVVAGPSVGGAHPAAAVAMCRASVPERCGSRACPENACAPVSTRWSTSWEATGPAPVAAVPRARPAAHQAATATGESAARGTHGGTGCEEDSA